MKFYSFLSYFSIISCLILFSACDESNNPLTSVNESKNLEIELTIKSNYDLQKDTLFTFQFDNIDLNENLEYNNDELSAVFVEQEDGYSVDIIIHDLNLFVRTKDYTSPYEDYKIYHKTEIKNLVLADSIKTKNYNTLSYEYDVESKVNLYHSYYRYETWGEGPFNRGFVHYSDNFNTKIDCNLKLIFKE